MNKDASSCADQQPTDFCAPVVAPCPEPHRIRIRLSNGSIGRTTMLSALGSAQLLFLDLEDSAGPISEAPKLRARSRWRHRAGRRLKPHVSSRSQRQQENL
jgi:hypothetical protein